MRRERLPLLALAAVALLVGLWVGLVRIGWAWPGVGLVALHGPLMVGGFFGTLISLERASGSRHRWALVVPAVSGAGTGAALAGATVLAAALQAVAAAGLFALLAPLLRHRTSFTVAMAGAPLLWLLGAALWITGRGMLTVAPFWMAFLVLFVVGERRELSRVLLPGPVARTTFSPAVAAVAIGPVVGLLWPDTGVRLLGVGLAASGAWLSWNDLARRTLARPGVTGFAAAGLLVGYGWLAYAGILLVSYGLAPVYDAALHAVFVGFTISMVFAHGPMVLRIVLHHTTPFRRLLWVWLGLLHAGLLLRVAGDLAGISGTARWGGLLSATAIVAYFPTLLWPANRGTGGTDPGLRAWRLALLAFVIAGSIGALWRFSAIAGAPWDLRFPDIRHAHSHLMYFSWATPALMALMARRVARRTDKPPSRSVRWAVVSAFLLGLVATPFFLLDGYGTTTLLGRAVPASGILSGLAIVPWTVFAIAHWRTSRGLARDTPLRAWDLALVFLALAAASAWTRALLAALDVEDLFWTTAAVHAFLDLFSLGWFGLGVLGLLHDGEGTEAPRAVWWTAAGIPLSWLLTMPVAWVPAGARLAAGAGALAMTAGLFVHAKILRQARGPAVALAVVAAAQLGLAVTPVASWGESMLLRVPYLHVLLLGFVTLGLVTAAHREWGGQAAWRPRVLATAVAVLLGGLVPLTGLWPAAWVGKWVLWAAAVTSLGPLLWAVAALVQGRKYSSSQASSSSSFHGS